MSSSKKTKQKNKIPAWLEEGSQQAVSIARGIADREYTPYEDQRIASFDPNEQRAYDLAANESGAYREDLDRSREFADRSGRSWTDLTDEERQAYINPFVQSALDPAAREIRQDVFNQQAELKGQVQGAGAFGGSRATLLETETARAGTQAIKDLYGEGYANAYESAANRFDKDRIAARGASESFRALGEQGQRQLTGELEQLLTTGGLKRKLEQAGLDFDYAQFLEARDWDVHNLQPLLAALSSVPHTTETVSKTSGGGLQAALGAATSIAGAYFTGGFSTMMGAGAGAAAGGGGGTPSTFGFSDVALKNNITLVGEHFGFNWYTWDWNEKAAEVGADQQPNEGVLADEVLMIDPDMVGRRDGYLTVDYGRICHG